MLSGFIICILMSCILPGATVSGEKSTALKFGKGGYSFIALNPDMSALTDKFTVCVWAKKLNQGKSATLFGYGGLSMFLKDSGHYRLFGTDRRPNTGVTVGVWTHHCLSWSSASGKSATYINGTLKGTYSASGSWRKLPTGKTLILGDIWDSVAKQRTGMEFGPGEMYNFNMFSKELTGTEVAELSAQGLSTRVPEELEAYRVIKWEEILKLTRTGTVQDIETEFDEATGSEKEEVSPEQVQAELLEVQEQLNSTLKELEETKEKLLANEGELSETRTGLEDTTLELKHTKEELEDTKEELNKTAVELKDTTLKLQETQAELEDVKQQLQNGNGTECAVLKGDLKKYDAFYLLHLLWQDLYSETSKNSGLSRE